MCSQLLISRGVSLSVCTISILVAIVPRFLSFFFFNDPATTAIYTLSLHDALPICRALRLFVQRLQPKFAHGFAPSLLSSRSTLTDRKSTRLNSSHDQISYAVFCLKKKKRNNPGRPRCSRDAQHIRQLQKQSDQSHP